MKPSLAAWPRRFHRRCWAEGDAVDQAALAGFLEQMAGQMDRLQQIQAGRDLQRDEAAAMADERVVVMAQAVEALIQRSEADHQESQSRVADLTEALSRLAQGQDRLVDLARSQAERPASPPPDMAGIEAALNRLAADLTEGRDEMVAELRSDILVLTRAVRAARFNDPFRDDLLRDPLVSRDRN